jgi:hypothetical protein
MAYRQIDKVILLRIDNIMFSVKKYIQVINHKDIDWMIEYFLLEILK